MADWAGIEQLYLSPSRPRGPLPEVSAALQRLVEAHGPLDSVVVRPHGQRYEILSNAETWLAAQRAGWREVPVDVRDDITDEEAEAILTLTSGAGRPDSSVLRLHCAGASPDLALSLAVPPRTHAASSRWPGPLSVPSA